RRAALRRTRRGAQQDRKLSRGPPPRAGLDRIKPIQQLRARGRIIHLQVRYETRTRLGLFILDRRKIVLALARHSRKSQRRQEKRRRETAVLNRQFSAHRLNNYRTSVRRLCR